MRLTNTLSGKKVARAAVAGTLAMAMLGATTGTAALQDIAEMTGTKTSRDARWLARLVTVPQGSVHLPSESRPTVNHAMAIQTFEGREFLNAAAPRESGRVASLDRSMKGDSVRLAKVRPHSVSMSQAVSIPPVTSAYASAKVALTAPELQLPLPDVKTALAVAAPAVAEPAAVANHRSTTPLRTRSVEPTRMAAAFRKTKGIDEDMYEAGTTEGRMALPDGQMAQARAAAGKMTRVLAAVKKAAKDGETTLAAYAPQDKTIASAFSAVLNPTAKTGVIRLARGDHKWAAKPLPRRARSAAERRCLANGVYFEARGESIEGQKAVAQVIVNRVKNPAYPNTICGVVYQNKHKRNACQFSFACDGIRDRISATRHWATAKKIANDAIDGRFWLSSVGSSSHYHADYVKPRWRRSMKRMVKIGRHIFYRTYGGGWS